MSFLYLTKIVFFWYLGFKYFVFSDFAFEWLNSLYITSHRFSQQM